MGGNSTQISGIQESNAPSEKTETSEIRKGNVREDRLQNAGKTILKIVHWELNKSLYFMIIWNVWENIIKWNLEVPALLMVSHYFLLESVPSCYLNRAKLSCPVWLSNILCPMHPEVADSIPGQDICPGLWA